MDITASLLILTLGLPVLAVTYVIVRLQMGSPVLFKQERIGLNGKPFTLYKFRSMKNAFDKDGRPLPDDQRLTSFGKILRSTSLDELPEIWSILKGEMSLIGPRPLLPEYMDYYSETEKRRHNMRPGLTGLAQVNGRNAQTWDQRLAYDVEYVDNWNIAIDLKILLATVKVVLSRQGVEAEDHVTMPRFDDYVRGGRKQPHTEIMS